MSGIDVRGARRIAARIAGAVILLAGLVAAPAGPGRAQGAPALQRVERILVEGNGRVADSTVKAYMTVREGEPATPDAINESVRRLLDTGLFRDVTISPLADGLLVQVVEAASINRVVFEGNDKIKDEDLAGVVKSAPRAAFSNAVAESDARNLTELYRRTGRYGASVTPVIIERDGNRVDLVFEIVEGEPTGVRSIDFVGNEVYSDRRLRGVIETSESGILAFLFTSDIYDPDRLELDKELLRTYYLDRGYADFQVLSATAELTADREDFLITFAVDEGEVYAFGDIDVQLALPGLDAEALSLEFQMAPGETYSAKLVDRTIDRLIYQVGLAGYAFIDVRPVARKNVEERTVDVTFQIAEGPRVYIERLDIEGNSRTVDRVLRRQFRFAEGDAYNAQAITDGRNNLRRLGYFSKVDVRTVRGSASDRAVVNVSVEEQLTGSISFGVGFSSSDGILGDISVTERNFLGRGQLVRAQINYTGDQQALNFTFEEPALLDRDLAVGFSIGLTALDRTDESSFEETNLGFRPFVEFPISNDERLRLRYRISSDEIRSVRFNASPSVFADKGTAITSSVGFTYSYDQRNDPIEPTGGYLYVFNQDIAGLGGDAFYSRSSARLKGWQGFFDGQLVASLELEMGGLISFGEDTRVNERFLLGGDDFRGFASSGIGPRDVSNYDQYDSNGNFVRTRRRSDSLGGNYFAVVRAEMSFPLGLPDELGFYGGVFADVGTVFGLDRTVFNETVSGPTNAGKKVRIDDDAYLRASIGVSLFVDSGFGPLRFNLAYPISSKDYDEREYFRFTAGTRF